MNKQRRKALEKIAEGVRDLIGQLEALRDEEQESFDNLPESFQNGERGEAMQTGIDSIESALGDLESAESSIQESTGAN